MKLNNNGEKISLEECKRILGEDCKHLNDDEILRIRNWLYKFTEITMDFLNSKSKDELNEIRKLIGRRK